MKEIYFDDMIQVKSIASQVWSALDTLRGEHISSEDYYLILFLLSVYKDGYLIDVDTRNPEKVRHSLLVALEYAEKKYDFPYLEVYRSFEHSISRLSRIGIDHILKSFSKLDIEVLRQHFPAIYDDILYRIAKSQGRYVGEFVQPIELTRLVINLADLDPHAKVYNPFAGAASFGVFLKNDQQYFGQEINTTIWAIGALRLHANNKWALSEYKNDNSVTHWNPADRKYDLIVANPPFRMRLSNSNADNFHGYRLVEQFLFDRGVASLSHQGKLIAILPGAFLFSGGSDKHLRTYMVEHDLIEMVISLPSGLLINTGLQLSIVVINKAKPKRGFITFVDAIDFVEIGNSREKILNDDALYAAIKRGSKDKAIKAVENEDVRLFDYNLSVPRYFQIEVEGVLLSDVLSPITVQRTSLPPTGKLVRIRDLKDDRINYRLDGASLEEIETPRFAQLVSETCLLVAARWKTLKPTLFEYEGTPILITPDIIALHIDQDKVDIGYLINELHAEYINEQSNAFRIGSIIPTIRKTDLLSIKIQLPDIEEQRKKIKIALEAVADEKKKALLYFNKVHGLEDEIVEQNAYLRHSLAGPSSNLKGSISNIKSILINQVAEKVPDLLKMKVSDKHELTLGEYLEIVERDATKISEAVSKQLRVEIDVLSKSLLPVEIISFIQKFVSEYNDKKDPRFSLELNFDKEVLLDEDGSLRKIYIQANPDLLSDLLNNLIDNAVKHGFSGIKGHHRIEIFFMSDINKNGINEFILLVSNTGNPFPQNFTQQDFIKKGSRKGHNDGDGYGGWYINEIVKKLNGYFEIVHEGGNDQPTAEKIATHFEITFPIIETETNEEV